MTIKIKFVGPFRHVAGIEKMGLDRKKEAPLKEVLLDIIKEIPALKETLSYRSSDDARTNVLILVNGREISALEGLETVVKDEDEIVFVPVVHGG
ncbi:MoaD/ThiS family protein [Candidatus Bathyarchaeota archaeon]|nr:MoaD/ThiS family protein [Candidatus Bathyarchaeota archaeon]